VSRGAASPPEAAPVRFAEFVAVWNLQHGQTMPALHVRICDWLEARWFAGDREIALLVFRGAGKSTLVGFFVAWLLVADPTLRVLVVAADLALAKKMVRHVRRIVERHRLCAALRPERVDQWAADQLSVRRPGGGRDPSVLAKGVEANLTGSRADVVICDDVEVPNTSDTFDKRAQLRARLAELEYVLVPGGLQLYVGTPHCYESIYAEEPRGELDGAKAFLDGFLRLELPLIDAAGKSLWPERFSARRIEAIRRRTGPTKFASQMLLRPVDPRDCRLDPERLVRYADEIVFHHGGTNEAGEALPGTLLIGGEAMVSASAYWDPSYGKPDGDASVVAAIFADGAGKLRLHRVAYLDVARELENSAEAQCRLVGEVVRALRLPRIVVESAGLGMFLPGLLRKTLREMRIGCAVLAHAPNRAKDLRILEAFDALLASGRLAAHASVFATRFAAEMREWRPGAQGRDDGLDAAAGAILALGQSLPLAPADADAPPPPRWGGTGRAYQATTDFDLR
jgi:hypothetical protein